MKEPGGFGCASGNVAFGPDELRILEKVFFKLGNNLVDRLLAEQQFNQPALQRVKRYRMIYLLAMDAGL